MTTNSNKPFRELYYILKPELIKMIIEKVELYGTKGFSFNAITLNNYKEYVNSCGLHENYKIASICYRKRDNKLWIERGNKKNKNLKTFPKYNILPLFKQIEKWLDGKYKWREKV